MMVCISESKGGQIKCHPGANNRKRHRKDLTACWHYGSSCYERPHPQSQHVYTAVFLAVVNSSTETELALVTNLFLPTRLPGFLLMLMQNALPASSVQLFSQPSHRLRTRKLNSTVHAFHFANLDTKQQTAWSAEQAKKFFFCSKFKLTFQDVGHTRGFGVYSALQGSVWKFLHEPHQWGAGTAPGALFVS